MAIAREVFSPASIASTITTSLHPFLCKARARARPVGPPPTIRISVVVGREGMVVWEDVSQ